MTETRPSEQPAGHDGLAVPHELSPAPRARLKRSRRHKVVGGVCSGLGRYYDLDPVIFRVVLGVAAATGGLGLIAYAIAWLLIPYEGDEENEGRRLLSGRVEGPALTALLFAVVGCGLFLSMLGNGSIPIFAVMLILATAGAAYWSRHRREVASGAALVDQATAQAVADAPPETSPPPVPRSPSWWKEPLTKDGSTGYLWGPGDIPEDAVEGAAPLPVSRRAKGRDEPAGIGGFIFLAALAAASIAFSLGGGENLSTRLSMSLAVALAVFGLGFVLSAWFGRTGGGTVFWSLVTTGLLACALVLPSNVTADWVRATWQPASSAAVQERYELGTGEAKLDLSGLELKKGETVRTRAEVGAGRLHVIVPEDVEVRLTAEVGLGDLQLPPNPIPGNGDIDIESGNRQQHTLEPANGEEPRGTLVLDLEVGLGQLEVDHAAP